MPAFTPTIALRVSIALIWVNYLLTARWANEPGALHGAKQPWFVAALVLTTVFALVTRPGTSIACRVLDRVLLAGSAAFLIAVFMRWFPPASWTAIPFQDDWPVRFQSTIDQAERIRRGAAGGWNWAFLGGYHFSSDFTQSLGALALIPMALFGSAAGFHALHLLLCLAVPAIVYLDVRIDREQGGRAVARVAAALACVSVAGYGFSLIKSGDTNSLGGLAGVAGALAGAHAARAGHRWGPALLIIALTLSAYTHFAFFLYAPAYLLLDAAVSRDRRSAYRAAIAMAAAFAGSLPLTWETWRYPAYFTFNNVTLQRAAALPLETTLRLLYYNVEIMFLPGRWFNDYGGLTAVLTPISLFVFVRGAGRARFYAAATLLTTVLLRFNLPQFGFAFIRPVHLYPLWVGPVVGWFLVRYATRRALAVAFLILIALYINTGYRPIPHVASVGDFNRVLVDRLAGLDGYLVLVENSFHPNMTADGRPTEDTPFSAHFEALLPPTTGRAYYAGMWDGWQWCPYRTNLLANGSFGGRLIDEIPIDTVVRELHRWGIRHLFVWSERSTARLSSEPAFRRLWGEAPWTHFELIDADTRSVVVPQGSGSLDRIDPFTADVALRDVRAGDLVVVRTNFHPAWRVQDGFAEVMPFASAGQLAFRATRDGSYTIRLLYPKRRRLWIVAAAAFALGFAVCARMQRDR